MFMILSKEVFSAAVKDCRHKTAEHSTFSRYCKSCSQANYAEEQRKKLSDSGFIFSRKNLRINAYFYACLCMCKCMFLCVSYCEKFIKYYL